MRKILILSLAFFTFNILFNLFIVNTPASALTKPGDSRCYFCPNKAAEGYPYVIPYEVGQDPITIPNNEPYCNYSDSSGGSIWEPAIPDKVCNTSTERCDDKIGCTPIDTDVQCNPPPEGTCNKNQDCRPKSSCTNNYCAVKVGEDWYQWTLEWPGALISGSCQNLPAAPKVPDPNNPPTEKATSGMTCDKPSDCLSGVCESGKCDNENLAPRICAKSGDGYGCRTAIGYFYADPERFSQSLLRVLLGLSGGILLVLIIFNGYKIMTSQGDPEKIKDAREGIIAAIAGILLIIFSLSILQLITVDIIGIPGFR